MSDEIEQAEKDELWLYNQLSRVGKKPSNEKVDEFIDRVWELLTTQGKDVGKSRLQALWEIFKEQ